MATIGQAKKEGGSPRVDENENFEFAVASARKRHHRWRCLPLISALQEHQVPIVIHSGWLPDDADLPLAIGRLPGLANGAYRRGADNVPTLISSRLEEHRPCLTSL